jgi:hypothetical protein
MCSCAHDYPLLCVISSLALLFAYTRPQKLQNEPGPNGPVRHFGVSVVLQIEHLRGLMDLGSFSCSSTFEPRTAPLLCARSTGYRLSCATSVPTLASRLDDVCVRLRVVFEGGLAREDDIAGVWNKATSQRGLPKSRTSRMEY